MGLTLSELIKKFLIEDSKNVSLIDEREFDYFARATTQVEGKKCVFITNNKYINNIDTSVSMVITSPEIAQKLSPKDFGICVTNEPRGLFFELMSSYDRSEGKRGEKTRIGAGCRISEKAIISETGVEIGNNVTIGDFVVIHPNTVIGDNTIIQTGCRIAEQDFNVFSYKGKTKQVFHGGRVIIGENVLLSPDVLVGQALYSYGTTVLGNNCYIGAKTCVGHNSEIGEGCEICGNSILGGYSKIGKGSTLFMNVTVANATSVGENVTVNMGSVVIRDVSNSKKVFGNPAREIISPR